MVQNSADTSKHAVQGAIHRWIGSVISCRYWKKKFVEVTGSQEKAVQYRTAIYLGASSVAE